MAIELKPVNTDKKIAFVDLERQYTYLKSEVGMAMDDVLASSQLILGPAVTKFEQEFAKYCDCRYAVGVGSGTSALHLALLASGVGEGDDVVTVPNTYAATAEAIIHTGARPVFVDVEESTGSMDVNLLARSVTARTKAILPVHLFGAPADMESILDFANKPSLLVIEDACQAHGSAYYHNSTHSVERPGSRSTAACFSFYPSKNLGCFGDGGMVVTQDEELAEQISVLRNHGQTSKHNHAFVGFNNRLDSLQAAILSVKLGYLNRWNAERESHAELYDILLSECEFIRPLSINSHVRYHAHHLYVVVTPSQICRDGLVAHLREQGVATGLHYPKPIHLQEAYSFLGYGIGDFPVAESLATTSLSLPMYPELLSEEIKYVCDCIIDFERTNY